MRLDGIDQIIVISATNANTAKYYSHILEVSLKMIAALNYMLTQRYYL